MKFYPVINISDKEIDNIEPLGTKWKFWYDDNDENSLLFKATKSEGLNGELVDREGENWAEKIAFEIANTLKIPCASYELALYEDESGEPINGVITPIMTSQGEELIHGNQLINSYLNKSSKVKSIDNNAHTIETVKGTLENDKIFKPKGWGSLPNIKTPLDFFIGYLLLDVLISNQDRHQENWGVIQTVEGTVHLSPTFDHAASLGRNETDRKRQEILTGEKGFNIEGYVRRANSLLYKNGARLKTIDAFKEMSEGSVRAMNAWLERLSNLKESEIVDIVSRVPCDIMSNVSKDFCVSLITANKVRLLEYYDG